MLQRLSIITICFNNLEDLKKTCTSVDKQLVKPYEHLIIDGSTKHNIKEWLIGNIQPEYRKWICERDNGIADAFNKGIRNAGGEITYLLNSGDEIYDETAVQKVMHLFNIDINLSWVNGKLYMCRAGIWAITGKRFEKDKLYRGMHGVFHPTMYIKKAVYDRHCLYDTTIKYAMDYDFLCRLADEKNEFIDYPLAIFDPTGTSSVQYIAATKEMLLCYQKYFGKSIKQILWGWRLIFLHHLLNSFIGKMLYNLKIRMGLQKV